MSMRFVNEIDRIIRGLQVASLDKLEKNLLYVQQRLEQYPTMMDWLFEDVMITDSGDILGGETFKDAANYHFILLWVLALKVQFGDLHLATQKYLNLSHFQLSRLPSNFQNFAHVGVLNVMGNSLCVLPEGISYIWINIQNIPQQVGENHHFFLEVSGEYKKPFYHLLQYPNQSQQKSITSVPQIQSHQVQGFWFHNLQEIETFHAKCFENIRALWMENTWFSSTNDHSEFCQNLRILHWSFDFSHQHVFEKLDFSWLENCTQLTALSLNNYTQSHLPSEIQKLSQLRHLSLREANIQELPQWLSALPNLESLDIAGCPLTNFPNVLLQMSSLKNVTVYSKDGLCSHQWWEQLGSKIHLNMVLSSPNSTVAFSEILHACQQYLF